MPFEQINEYFEEVSIEKNKLNINTKNDILNSESFNLFIDSSKDRKISHEYMIRTKWGHIKVDGVYFLRHALLLKSIIEKSENFFIDDEEISFLINPALVMQSGEFKDWYDFELTFKELEELFLQVVKCNIIYSHKTIKGIQKILTNNKVDFREYEPNKHSWLCGDEIMWKVTFSAPASLIMLF